MKYSICILGYYRERGEREWGGYEIFSRHRATKSHEFNRIPVQSTTHNDSVTRENELPGKSAGLLDRQHRSFDIRQRYYRYTNDHSILDKDTTVTRTQFRIGELIQGTKI